MGNRDLPYTKSQAMNTAPFCSWVLRTWAYFAAVLRTSMQYMTRWVPTFSSWQNLGPAFFSTAIFYGSFIAGEMMRT